MELTKLDADFEQKCILYIPWTYHKFQAFDQCCAFGIKDLQIILDLDL